jgi:hypothetical protein
MDAYLSDNIATLRPARKKKCEQFNAYQLPQSTAAFSRIQQLLISAMKKEPDSTAIYAKPHSRNFLKSETKQNGLAQWLDVFVRSVGLLISKGTISEDDYGANGFTGLFNFADIFRAFIALRHIANPQVQTCLNPS